MSGLLDVCPGQEKKAILEKFKALTSICLPSKKMLSPSFKFKTQEDFSGTDELVYGVGEASIPPAEIREYSYQDRQTLRDSCIDFIETGKQRWFYNTWEMQGNFFSEDGQKKVEVAFNFWADAEKIWSVPGIKQAMRSVLMACSGDSFPTEEEAQKFFTHEMCYKIYQRQPPVQSIKQAVLELIEPLRKILTATLVSTHAQAISTSKKFRQYVQSTPAVQARPLSDQVNEYLKKNKNAVYLFGEKFGFIKSATKAIHYQEIRDSVRHPQEVQAALSHPKKVYEDFCAILMIPLKSSRFRPFKKIVGNLEAADSLERMSEILDIIAIYENKSLKRKNPAYWQDLVNQGILDAKEVPYLQKMVKACASVAHVNPDSKKRKNTVRNDGRLLEISLNVQNRHEQKQAPKNAEFQEWLNNTASY